MSNYSSNLDPEGSTHAGAPQAVARKKGPNWLLIVAVFVLGGIGLAVCSCGLLYLTLPAWSQIFADQVAKQVADDTVMQDKIGTIEKISYSIAESSAAQVEGKQMMAFDVSGSKGTGLLVVEIAAKGGEIDVMHGELVIPDGQTLPLESLESSDPSASRP